MLVPEFPYYINLGFWYLKFFLILSAPVVGYVVRRKWLFAVAKEAEINRLMVLTAEEADRVEYEAQEVGYYSHAGVNGVAFGHGGEVSVNKGSFVNCPDVTPSCRYAEVVFQCAVCLSPTTTRCSRCKSVRYCSAKCQFFHWREGHKDQCHPPGILNHSSDTESYQHSTVFDQEKPDTPNFVASLEIASKRKKPSHTHLEGGVLSEESHSEQLKGKSDDGNAETVQDVLPSNLTASFSSSFSSVSSQFSSNSDSSDDTSIPESSGSSDNDKSIDSHFTDASIAKSASEIKTSDDKGGTTTARLKLNGQKTISTQHDSQGTSYTKSKGSDPVIAKSGPSDFWEASLDYSWSDYVKTKCSSTNVGVADIRSSMIHTQTLTGKNEKNSHVDGKPHFSLINEPSNKAASFTNTDTRSLKVYPTISRSKTRTPTKEMAKSIFNNSGCSDVNYRSSATVLSPQSAEGNADVQKLGNFPISTSKKVDLTVSGTDCKSKPRHSSSSHRDGTLRNSKIDSISSAADSSISRNTTCSSLFIEKNERTLSSTESDCNVWSLKSRVVGSVQLSSHVLHSSINSSKKVGSSVSEVDVVKSNNEVTKSDKSFSHTAANSLKTSTWKAVDQFIASKTSRSRFCGADERHDNKGLFSYELFKSLYGWNQIELRPRGLVNCGNSCYANSVLQCLSFTPPLTAYLLQGLHSKNCTKIDWCFTCEFENLILKAKDGNSPISPIGIISQLPSIGSHISNGRQEDAHEFLRYVVEAMQSICMKGANNKGSSNVEEETSLLGLTFGGYLQSKIRCLKCGGKSVLPERIMDMSVEIEGSIKSLEDALKRFTFTETLDAENKYNCARCKSYQNAKKKLTLLEAPNILTIALKRFQVGKFGKLNKWIDFPEVLDMAPYMSRTSDDKAPVYKLYGVIVHLDTMNATFSGHYVCYVKNILNKWFFIDDSVVKTVDFGTVKEQAAYLLLYARCLPRAPKSLGDKRISNSKANANPPKTGHYPISAGPNSTNFNHRIKSAPYCNGHHVKFETDSHSDDSSLFSSCSEYSRSTESTIKESNSADDLADLIFGLSHPCKSSSDTLSPSSSPFCSLQDHSNRPVLTEKSKGINLFCADPSSHCRKVDYNCSNISNVRQQKSEKPTNVDSLRHSVPSRHPSSARRG